MIVRSVRGHLELITQPDHARAARAVMERCVPLQSRARREAILYAIEQHDNGWAEIDAAPAVNPRTGTVFDFVDLPVPARQAIWPRGVARLAADPWAAALVAHHAITVYDRFRSDPEWTSFFIAMTEARDRMAAAAALPYEELVADYPFLRLADLISLAFCTQSVEEQPFDRWTIRRSGSRVIVTPDTFGDSPIPLEVRAREIRNGPFASDDDLRNALNAGRLITLRGEVASTPI